MSTLGKILPLIITLVVLAIAAFVGIVIYSIVNDVADKTSKKMEEKNVIFTKDGMRVGVKELKGEDFVGSTQNILVKAWNFSTWPAYKSRFWNKEQQPAAAERRPSSQHRPSEHLLHKRSSQQSQSQATLTPTQSRTPYGRSSSSSSRPHADRKTSVPGSFDG